MSNNYQEKAEIWRRLLRKNRVIAVIRSSELELGLAMAKAVAKGGIKIIEITWNSHQPAELIKTLIAQLPDCTIGTGTILTLQDLEQAIAAGVQFVFCPHVNVELVEAAIGAGIPIIPGTLSPTEIVAAWQAGASCVKVFPIQAVGGVDYIKSLQGPLGEIPLIPTGGVTLNNAKDFITAGAIAVGLSGELFPRALLKQQDWQAISDNAKNLLTSLEM
jgi:2-dehydro-3-deoxyphosphogluconate aldolase/(4S)-4-hydroxy-2-oxoglutarate aldolase